MTLESLNDRYPIFFKTQLLELLEMAQIVDFPQPIVLQ